MPGPHACRRGSHYRINRHRFGRDRQVKAFADTAPTTGERDAKLQSFRSLGRVAIAIALLLVGTKICGAETAEEMVSACHFILDAKVSNNEVDVPNDSESGLCWGAFLVLQKVIVIAAHGEKIPFLRVCAPADSTRTQLIAVFVEYAKRHPERYNEDFFFVAIDAERASFPCNLQKKSQ